jgi:hypothetical protein
VLPAAGAGLDSHQPNTAILKILYISFTGPQEGLFAKKLENPE